MLPHYRAKFEYSAAQFYSTFLNASVKQIIQNRLSGLTRNVKVVSYFYADKFKISRYVLNKTDRLPAGRFVFCIKLLLTYLLT